MVSFSLGYKMFHYASENFLISFIAFVSVQILFSIPLQIPLAIRRFHDFGYNGWHAIFLFIPVANTCIWLVLVFTKGDAGKNKYGEPPPKEDLRAEISHSLITDQYVQRFEPDSDTDEDAESSEATPAVRPRSEKD